MFALALVGHESSLFAQDFDPAGRRRRPTPTSPSPSRPSTPRTPRPASPPSSAPSQDTLIQRYFAIVLSQPGEAFPLERLAQLHRERDGNLAKLIAALEERAASQGPDQWSAKLALAGAHRLDGKPQEAMRLYREAIEEKPKHPAPRLALAELLQSQGERQAAREQYEAALPIVASIQREQVLRSLVSLCLDLGDFEGAKRHHRELVRQAQGSFYVRAELARELMARNDYARAEEELRGLVQAASGDHRTLLPALRDLGRALLHGGKHDEAVEVLNRALRLAGRDVGIRRELLDLLVDVHRQQGNLVLAVEKLESAPSKDAQLYRKLGELYEELGRVDDALAAHKKAAQSDPRDFDARLRVIQLLSAKGEIDKAIAEYEALVRAAPQHPEYTFELCELLLRRGERERALRKLRELERRVLGDESALSQLVDFYEHIGESDAAQALLQKLAASSRRDPQPIIDLGDRYWQKGDEKRAIETWARIRHIVPDKAKALFTLAEVYLEHDKAQEALAMMREALELEPRNLSYKKAYALALERAAASEQAAAARKLHGEALEVWNELLATAQNDRNLAREAQMHVVLLHARLRSLEAQVTAWRASFARNDDVEAGRLLAEALIRLRRLDEAKATLQKLTRLLPGDADVLLSLERVQVMGRDLEGALETLAKLVEVDPRRAREFYRRMAEYAAALYRDEDAVRYAERAVLLSPDDAEGHAQLGDLYRKKQDIERAIASYRTALAKNDRLFPIYFELSELLLSQGQADEADRLLRRVVRMGPDAEMVTQAARRLLQLHRLKGTLSELEQEFFALAIGNPRNELHRRLLVMLYAEMASPLLRAARDEAGEEGDKARKALAELGERGLKPLLDALSDEREDQQALAVELLSFVEKKTAGPALFAYATGEASLALREKAMLACANLRDASLLPRYREWLLPKDETALRNDAVATAAAWAVARLESEKARPVLWALLEKGSPEVRAVAAWGLAKLRDRKAEVELVRLARAADAPSITRAAAVLALGELKAQGALATVSHLAYGGSELLRRAALVSLAKLRGEAAKEALAEALFASEPAVRATALALVIELSEKRPQAPSLPPRSRLNVATVLLPPAPEPTPEQTTRALLWLGPELRAAAVGAAMTSPEKARLVDELLFAQEGASSPDVAELRASIAAAVVPAFADLARHPSMQARARAAAFLATRKEDEAQKAVLAALADPAESVVLAALSAMGPSSPERLIVRVVELVGDAPSWPVRRHAARALERVGASLPATSKSQAIDTLTKAAREDENALVREAALDALVAIDAERASPVLKQAGAEDPEPRIRERARRLLAAKSP